MPAELTEGETYLAKATTTNMSTKAGAPVAAVLTVNIAGVVNSQTILEGSEVYGFAAGETHTFEFPMAVPMGAGGKAGAVVAEVLDPNENKLADGSLDVVIKEAAIPLDGGWTCSGAGYSYVGPYPGAPAWSLFRYTCQITSMAPATTTKAIAWQRRWKYGATIGDWIQPSVLYDGTYEGVPNPRQITLAPGEIFSYIANYSEGTGIQVQLRLVDELGNIGGLTGWIAL